MNEFYIFQSGEYCVNGALAMLESGDLLRAETVRPAEAHDVIAEQWQQHLDALARPTRCKVCGKLEPECEFNERF